MNKAIVVMPEMSCSVAHEEPADRPEEEEIPPLIIHDCSPVQIQRRGSNSFRDIVQNGRHYQIEVLNFNEIYLITRVRVRT